MFQLSLDNANQQTQQSAAASGRLSAGDTLEQLSNNVLLASQPLIDRQRQDVTSLLNLGTGVASSQANIEQGLGANVGNLTTDIGAALAGGQVGAANARTAGAQGLAQLGLSAAALSDRRLKTNIKPIGKRGKHEWYTWDWNSIALEVFGMKGSDTGVIAQEVLHMNPRAVILDPSGYYKVNYEAL